MNQPEYIIIVLQSIVLSILFFGASVSIYVILVASAPIALKAIAIAGVLGILTILIKKVEKVIR